MIRPEAVHRPRLLTRLEEGRQKQLTLVCAPAGFGKTTLVSQWLAKGGQVTAWLSLDKRDNDLMRFLAGLAASLQSVPIQFDDNLSDMIASPQPPTAEYLRMPLAQANLAHRNAATTQANCTANPSNASAPRVRSMKTLIGK